MSQNLVEFLKVLTIVVSWSTCILAGRHYMLSIDDSREEDDEGLKNKPEDRVAVKIPVNQNSDTMDYDGMGNYGRFPKKIEKK